MTPICNCQPIPKSVMNLDIKRADYDSSWEPYVELVEHGGAVFGVHVGYHGVTGGFHRSIGKSDKECGDNQRPEPSGHNGEHQAQ
jgi:hypothetical protein